MSCIHLEFEACVSAGLDHIRTSDITDVGDIYLDIVDAFIAKGRYADAKPMLKSLTECDEFDKVRARECSVEIIRYLHELSNV